MSTVGAAPATPVAERLQEVVDGLGPHPFEARVNGGNVRRLMANYLAMSEAFPYLQAGAQRALVTDAIEKNRGLADDSRTTAVVGNFLTADETGVNYVLKTYGVQGLPRILESDTFFHAHLLKRDLLALFGRPVEPDYGGPTAAYLMALLADLESLDPVRRCAAMVAFERHAGSMIEALWASLSGLFPVNKDDLLYFKVHVGGDDPAEPYHVVMTARMIERLVPAGRQEEFVAAFRDAYRRNLDWCEAICA